MTATAPSTYAVESLSWEEHTARVDWRPGEHITLIGPNGAGKTELITRLVEQRKWNLFLGTKRIDETQTRLTKSLGFRHIRDAAELNPQIASRFYFKPDWPRKLTAAKLRAYQAAQFREILDASFWQTGWTTYADELRYLTDILGLKDEIVLHLIQGRAQKSGMVSGTQRPRFVPLEVYDQAYVLYFWRDNDSQNISRISEMAGLNRQQVMEVVPSLARHDVLVAMPFTGDLFVTNTRW